MKNRITRYGVLFTALAIFASCKDKESDVADERITALEKYVDSLESVKTADAEANWEAISADYDRRTAESNEAIATLDDDARVRVQARLDSVNARYVVIKTSVENAKAPAADATVSADQALRDKLFGVGKLGDDLNFSWVNKDNIRPVYEQFYDAYKANKDSFTREDYDEIKLIYEALDARKNTVEKEGLSADDNSAIAAIKFRFAPMFKTNRIGAKARENEEAKE